MAEKSSFSEWIRNPYTGEELEIKATTRKSLENKVQSQRKKWDDEESRIRKEEEKREHDRYVEMQREEAKRLTMQDCRMANYIKNGILRNMRVNSVSDYYDSLFDKRNVSSVVRNKPSIEQLRKDYKVPREHKVLESIFPRIIERRERLEKQVQSEYKKWGTYYEKRKAEFLAKQDKHNKEIERKRLAFYDGDVQEIERYFSYCIVEDAKAGYNIDFVPRVKVIYVQENKTIIVDFEFPTISLLPKERYEYNERKDMITSIERSKKEL